MHNCNRQFSSLNLTQARFFGTNFNLRQQLVDVTVSHLAIDVGPSTRNLVVTSDKIMDILSRLVPVDLKLKLKTQLYQSPSSNYAALAATS
jgi:hypothetical protein